MYNDYNKYKVRTYLQSLWLLKKQFSFVLMKDQTVYTVLEKK